MVEIHQQADIGFRHEDVRAPEKLVHHPEGADKGLFLFRELRLGRFGDPDLRDPVRAVSLDQFDRVVEHEHGAEGRKVVRYMIHGFLQRLRINCFPREGAEVGEVGHDQVRGIELVIQVIQLIGSQRLVLLQRESVLLVLVVRFGDRLRVFQRLRDGGGGPVLIEQPDADPRLVQLGDQGHAGDGIPADPEEVVMDPDPVNPQDPGHDAAEALLRRIGRRGIL